MSRPQKCRRVCTLPRCGGFRPMEDAPWSGTVTLGVDEYEVIRLIDLEGLTQEQCAVQMEVARTTVTGIYLSARRKLAQAWWSARRWRWRGALPPVRRWRMSPPGARMPQKAEIGGVSS